MPRTKTIKVIAVEIPRYGQLKDPLPINAYLNVEEFNKMIGLIVINTEILLKRFD